MSNIDPQDSTDNLVSKEQILASLPGSLKMKVSDDFVNVFNDAITGIDSEYVDAFRTNFTSFSSVLNDGKWKITDYLNAVKYVSFKLMGFTNRDSYKMTFPDRYLKFMNKYRLLGFDDAFIWDNKISPHVVAYNKRILVNKIMEQTVIPPHVLNMSMYQDALNTQAELMKSARSEMVRATAANSILTQLRPPDTAKLEIDISIKESDAIKDLKRITQELSLAQQKAIESGATSSHVIAESKIVIAEIEEAEEIDFKEAVLDEEENAKAIRGEE